MTKILESLIKNEKWLTMSILSRKFCDFSHRISIITGFNGRIYTKLTLVVRKAKKWHCKKE